MWVGGVTQLTVDFARVLRWGWKVARGNRNPKLVLKNALYDLPNCWRNLDGRAKIGFLILSLFCFPGWLQGKKGPCVGGTKVELRHFCFVTSTIGTNDNPESQGATSAAVLPPNRRFGPHGPRGGTSTEFIIHWIYFNAHQYVPIQCNNVKSIWIQIICKMYLHFL